MVNRHYIPRHKVKYPCMECGYDIMHDGVEPRRCAWNWSVRWIMFWHHLGVEVALEGR